MSDNDPAARAARRIADKVQAAGVVEALYPQLLVAKREREHTQKSKKG